MDLAAQIQAASKIEGVDDVVGALRLTMSAVMLNEDDPAKLASAVAKISAVLVAAMRAKHVLQGDAADSLTDAVTAILAELNPA